MGGGGGLDLGCRIVRGRDAPGLVLEDDALHGGAVDLEAREEVRLLSRLTSVLGRHYLCPRRAGRGGG